jgi:nucleoside-diphosphate-sugar epimerase
LENAKRSKNFQFIEGSILSSDDLDKLPKVDCLYHFAAIAGVRNSILNPEEYYRINVEGTKKLLDKFKDGAKKIVFASTSSVYGEVAAEDFPVKEDHPLNPISPYGQTKKEAEKICMQHSKETNTKLTMLRFYTVYGPRQRPDEAFTKFIRLAQEKKPIPKGTLPMSQIL